MSRIGYIGCAHTLLIRVLIGTTSLEGQYGDSFQGLPKCLYTLTYEYYI